jgi:hypothetical protein
VGTSCFEEVDRMHGWCCSCVILVTNKFLTRGRDGSVLRKQNGTLGCMCSSCGSA